VGLGGLGGGGVGVGGGLGGGGCGGGVLVWVGVFLWEGGVRFVGGLGGLGGGLVGGGGGWGGGGVDYMHGGGFCGEKTNRVQTVKKAGKRDTTSGTSGGSFREKGPKCPC